MIAIAQQSRYIILQMYLALLLVCNLHLLHGTEPSALIFNSELVASGEWWRIFTHLMVHVSWYHLLLDATAVAILWRELNFGSSLLKYIAAMFCAAGSLLFAILFSPIIRDVGFCGLSGMAHGLMVLLSLIWVYQALCSAEKHSNIKIKLLVGCLLFFVTLVKSVIEVYAGGFLLGELHNYDLGVPIVHAHLGGVFGGGASFLLFCMYKNHKTWENRRGTAS